MLHAVGAMSLYRGIRHTCATTHETYHTMKTRTVALSIMMLTLAFGYTYHLGYSHGSNKERLRWLWTYKEGVLTARENPAYFKPSRMVVARDDGSLSSSVNTIPVTYSPR